MGKGKQRSKGQRKSAKDSRARALNAFDTAVDDSYYIKGLRQQQDIDLDHVADDRIRQLLSNQVNSEDDEDIDSDEAMGSASDISIGEHNDGDEDDWGESLDEAELLPLSEVWDLNDDSASRSESDELETPKLKEKEPSSRKARKDAAQSAKPLTTEPEDLPLQDRDADSESEEASGSDSDENISEDGSSDPESSDDDGLNGRGSASAEESLGLSDDDQSESDEFSDAEEDTAALRRAIKSVTESNERDFSATKLVDAGAENPFALPRTSLSEALTLDDMVPNAQKAKTLSIPAPQRIQERANREAAFELAREEVDKWADTVATNRRAEHLQFPINATPQLQTASPFAGTGPSQRNELEEKVASILRTSQLEDEKQASTFEETAPSALSVEDLRKRRDQLRYMRDLMFREERRAKRIKKIKSKTYRKIHKKERERMAELENSEEDGDGGDSLRDAERHRALERATLRHKSNSKWAKRMLEQGLTRDAGTRGDIEEMLRQSDALRQKIRGDNEDDGSSEDDFDFARDAADEQDGESQAGSKKGVLGMKFMQEAAKRERQANERLLNDDYSDGADDDNTNEGRKSYNPAGQQLKRDLEAMEAESADEDRRDTSDKTKARQRGRGRERVERGDETLEFRRVDDEPLVPPSAQRTPHHQPRKHTNGAGAAAAGDPSAASENPWLKATENSSVPGMVKLASGKKSGEKQGSKNPRSTKITVENTFGDTLVREKDMTFEQQDLVRQAFAGDDVVGEFEAEKRAEVEQDQDQEVDETLPGWGSWSNEAPRVQKIRKIAGLNDKQRRDYKKKDILINEKLNKKAAKYSASAVPFPFENRQQYERSLRMPIGQEWVTKDTFQRQTKPRVLVKRSTVIDPIKKPKFN